jgi:hypothetical protein
MPRPARLHVPYGVYHVTLRGNNRQPLFFDDGDQHRLDKLVATGCERYGCRIHAYCWITNHIHVAVQIGDWGLGISHWGASYNGLHPRTHVPRTAAMGGRGICLNIDTALRSLNMTVISSDSFATFTSIRSRRIWFVIPTSTYGVVSARTSAQNHALGWKRPLFLPSSLQAIPWLRHVSQLSSASETRISMMGFCRPIAGATEEFSAARAFHDLCCIRHHPSRNLPWTKSPPTLVRRARLARRRSRRQAVNVDMQRFAPRLPGTRCAPESLHWRKLHDATIAMNRC